MELEADLKLGQSIPSQDGLQEDAEHSHFSLSSEHTLPNVEKAQIFPKLDSHRL